MSRTNAAHVVGARVDWLEVSFRCELDATRVLPLLRAQGAMSIREDAPCAIAFGEAPAAKRYGEPGLRAFKLHPPSRAGKWLLQNALMRVEVLEHGPRGDGAKDGIGWTVRVIMSGTSMLAMGWGGAVREAWAVAELLGVIHEARFGRTDLCCDVANYDLRPDDRHSFIKSRRLTSRDNVHEGKARVRKKKVRRTDGTEETVETVTWHQDGRRLVDDDGGMAASYVGDDTFTGFSFGLSRKAVSARIYDKVLELRTPKKKGSALLDADKRRAEFAAWREGGWKYIDEEPDVTRVEFQVNGEALEELGLRCATRPEEGGAQEHAARLMLALDPAWQYLTQKWLRLGRRGEKDVVQPRWRVVQEVTFIAAAAPRKRVRQRTYARAAQTLGCELSLVASSGQLHLPWVREDTGEVVKVPRTAAEWNKDPGRMVSEYFYDQKTPEELEAAAREKLHHDLRLLGVRAADRIARAEIDRAGGARGALSRVWCKWNASLARCQGPGEIEEESESATVAA
jgi:hypothetical protein